MGRKCRDRDCYTEERPKELIDMMAKGYLDCEIYAAWRISKNTFYRWMREHQELREAHEIGMPLCEKARIVDPLTSMAKGELEGKHSFNAIKMLAANKFGYTADRPDSSGNTTNINVQQMNLFQGQTKEQLSEFIKAKMLDNIVDGTIITDSDPIENTTIKIENIPSDESRE